MASTMNCSECGQRLEAANEEALREKLTLHMAENHPFMHITEEEILEMVETSQEDAGLVKLGDSGLNLEAPEQDLRGCEVFDNGGENLGTVEDLYVDERASAVRFLEVRASDEMGVGNRSFLIPGEVVSETDGDRVTLSLDRERVAGSPETQAGKVPSLTYQQESQKYFGFGAYHD